MESKFSLKDLVNYVVSGFLWLFLLSVLIFFTTATKVSSVFEFVNTNIATLKEFIGVGSVALLVLSYLLGNILRPMEAVLVLIVKLLFGDLYQNALKPDKIEKYKNKFLKYLFGTISINSTYSAQIYEKLSQDNLVVANKKSQFIMLERFLRINGYTTTYERAKDLKDLYESTFLPLIILGAITPLVLNLEGMVSQIVYWITYLLVVFFLVKRYVFSYHNYIKDAYRNYLTKKDALVTSPKP